MILTVRSLQRLVGVHPDLVKVVTHAAENPPVDFQITCGVRTIKEQQLLMDGGASALKDPTRSRHVSGHAVDVCCILGGKARWDWPLYVKLAAHFKSTAQQLGIPIEWGGDWKTFKDGPHYQLPWKQYPRGRM